MENVDRRTLIKAGAAAAGVGALAGCAAESNEDTPSRPVFQGDMNSLSPELRFIVESLDYQNEYVEQQFL